MVGQPEMGFAAAADPELDNRVGLVGSPPLEPDAETAIGTASEAAGPLLRSIPTDGSLELELRHVSALINAPRWKLAAKRFVDICVAGTAVTLLMPIMLMAALALLITSGGPVLFKQERIARNGKRFSMLKFRSMYKDAEDRLVDIHILNEQTGPVFKIKDDPRITRIGRLLRRWSIDELPQLFHVLSGRMSLVGPRPALPEEVELYTDHTRQRLLAKPGLTCTWQVSGRSDIDFDTWVEMDLDYVRDWSLLLDAKLLFSTIPAVITGKGAY